jgi:hypothetical protein
MAQVWHYQNGLYLPGPDTSTGGLAIARWLYEFATQICGWTDYDSANDSKWTAVNASGTNGASVPGYVDRLSTTGDSYDFMFAHDSV